MSDAEGMESDAEYDENTESENDNEEQDPWQPMIEKARQRHETALEEVKTNLIGEGVDERVAEDLAYSSLLPELQKELERIHIERLLWIEQLKKDPVHRKIMQTKKDFVENDNFDNEEAIDAAVDKRKFLIKRMLENSLNNYNDDS